MKHLFVCAVTAAALLSTGIASADPPPWAGGGKGHAKGHGKGKGKGHGPPGHERHFADEHRALVHEYYAEDFRRGRCPPGLAKKRNGCMPPGQAKKWQVGRPLPREVTYYEVPPALVVQLGTPPPGRRYVRVANDILLIATGTGIVIDAIEDLGRI